MKVVLALILMISLNAVAATADNSASSDTVAMATVPTNAPAATDSAIVPTTETATATLADAKKETAILLKTKETEIPVHLENDKKVAAADSPIFKVLMSLSIIGVLGCGIFFWFRKFAKDGKTKNQATQIKVLTQHYLGPKRSLAIIRVAGESILVGITDHNISLIKELSLLDEEIPEATPKSFKTVFAVGQNENVNFSEQDQDFDQEEAREEFAFSGIKDFVSSKLKNMRSIE